MSRASELAKAEADRVEAEENAANKQGNPGDETTTEAEREAETTETEPLSEEAVMARMSALLDRHERGMRGLFGAEFDDMQACSFCNGIGFREEPTMTHHPDTETCRMCNGYGKLVTGSNIPTAAAIDCTQCGGQGFTHKAPPMPTPAPMAPQPIYVDPTTGLQVPAPGYGNGASGQGTWAPGHQPQPSALPPGAPQS